MATEDARKLFVAGLPESINEDVLRQLFEATGGTVVNISLPRDRATGRPRGFGFVTLSSPEEADGARAALDGSLQAGRAISVRPFSSEPPRREARTEGVGGGHGGGGGAGPSPDRGGGDRTLYVGNLPYDTNQQEMEQLFSDNDAGPVVRVHLPAGPDGRLRGFGFVSLASAEAANAAIVALRDKDLRGRRLMINIAHPRGERPPGSGPGAGGGGGAMSDRSPRPPRAESRPFEPVEFPPFANEARPDGRRRAERMEKKKKKKTRSEKPGPQPKRKGKGWEDWDDD